MKKVFALIIVISSIINLRAQEIPYGNNPNTGKYVQSDDARIYYEVYGKGEPLLLLHGGYYGYISEFELYLPILAENFKVIAVATRGHGKSEIGIQKMSYQLFAQDAINVLIQEGIDNAQVLGFSDGGITGTVIASEYPSYIKKLVCMGGAINTGAYRVNSLQEIWEMDSQYEEQNMPEFLKERRKIMPQPERYAEWIDMLKEAWLEPVVVTTEAAKSINCNMLIVCGDRDNYLRLESIVEMYKFIPNSQLLIMPNSGHVDLILNPSMLKNLIIPFFKE